ncbi:MAG: GNAT family N-acetyltransferase [Anaerolineales bacterium]|nr:GNAT family N-acetyltransferase [Anaerolineales bacterium]
MSEWVVQVLTVAHVPQIVALVAAGYETRERYVVSKQESEGETAVWLRLEMLPAPVTRHWTPDEAAEVIYRRILRDEMGFGMFADGRLVAIALTEEQPWNRTLWVWEFHVAPDYRGQGIGRQLMSHVAGVARTLGMRTMVCETQNWNVPAIRFYRAVGFALEGIDLSYYTNEDLQPGGDVALFMKRRLE